MALALPDILFTLSLFIVGAAGALATVYASRDTVVPSFRSWLTEKDAERIQKEIDDHRGRARRAMDDRDRLQREIEEGRKPLAMVALLRTHEKEIDEHTRQANGRQFTLEKTDRGAFWQGIVSYVALGGVFGAALATVASTPTFHELAPGFATNNVLEAAAVGAAWPAYWSRVRLQKKVPEAMADVRKGSEAVRRRVEELEAALKPLVPVAQPDGSFRIAVTDAARDESIRFLHEGVRAARKAIDDETRRAEAVAQRAFGR